MKNNETETSLTPGNGDQGVVVKKCKRCGEEKPESAFGKYSPSTDCPGVVKARCRSCDTEVQMDYYRRNPEKMRQYNADSYREQRRDPEKWARRCARKREVRFGLPDGTIKKMLLDQGGVCKICGVDITGKKKSHIDHDHSTGKVRSLLCGNCNVTLGHAKENIETLRKVIAYLELFGR